MVKFFFSVTKTFRMSHFKFKNVEFNTLSTIHLLGFQNIKINVEFTKCSDQTNVKNQNM